MPPSLMFAAVATHPPAPHVERTAQLPVVAGAFGDRLVFEIGAGPEVGTVGAAEVVGGGRPVGLRGGSARVWRSACRAG